MLPDGNWQRLADILDKMYLAGLPSVKHSMPLSVASRVVRKDGGN